MIEAFNAFVEKNNNKIANAAKRMAEASELERLYGRSFLQKSMSEAGCRWREITAPNAASFD